MPKTIVTHCNVCSNDTNQKILYNKKIIQKFDEEDENSSEEILEYMTLQCAGCNLISFLRRESGDFHMDDNGNPYHIDYNFPATIGYSDNVFLEYEDVDRMPAKIAELYNQAEQAFIHESHLLAGIGLRMLVETICIEQKVQASNLKLRIIKLHEDGLISKNEILILDKLREIGNVSAHEIKSIPIEKLKYALDIINHVLTSIYILPQIVKKLNVKK